MILEDQIVQLSDFENNSQPTQTPTVFEHTRPDLCVIDHVTRKCLIVEVPVPFDVFANDCYQSKFNRYLPLSQAITEKDCDQNYCVNCWFTGQWTLQIRQWVEVDRHPHKQSQAHRKILFSERHDRSRIIWKQRCRSMFAHPATVNKHRVRLFWVGV